MDQIGPNRSKWTEWTEWTKQGQNWIEWTKQDHIDQSRPKGLNWTEQT